MFPISDRPYQNMYDPNLFDGFHKKKKNSSQEIYKLRDDLLAVVKVTKNTLQHSLSRTDYCVILNDMISDCISAWVGRRLKFKTNV